MVKRYVGISVNSGSWLVSHNWGRTKSTKVRRPFVLVHTERAKNRIEARKREKYLKSAAGRRFRDKLETEALMSPAHSFVVQLVSSPDRTI